MNLIVEDLSDVACEMCSAKVRFNNTVATCCSKVYSASRMKEFYIVTSEQKGLSPNVVYAVNKSEVKVDDEELELTSLAEEEEKEPNVVKRTLNSVEKKLKTMVTDEDYK